ncbi:MAG: Anthranilate phosphoribosyltransferase (EC [uncultured Thiotrichaceae bacterium]|uniref:Anthranilate phosphoribosyltransferase (EC) n=1 Tax=uncultured Thiotrichaceae bacterium TaxID=298394 RepID=A0A6S6UFD5_9GAMM|nr:MAG: Anthranilate phosphoribosyltransferase (EC [uncultured Thiotrichaceae bacterium]
MNQIDDQLIMRQCIQKVATGPEYSKDLDFDEAKEAMRVIIEGNADPVQTAIFFIALRMKRETNDENCGILQALIDSMQQVTAPVDEIVDICDPYDGYTRGVPASPFIPAVLAELSVNAITHGLHQVGPKGGATFNRVYQAAGLNVSLSPNEAAEQVGNIGWAYIDQAQFAPQLHDLIPLRQRIIKRQVLTTVETMLGPIRGKNKTHLLGGYVHKAYPPIYEALARHGGFDSAMFVRGVEGGIIPSLQQSGKLFFYEEGTELQQRDLSPSDIEIKADRRAVPIPEGLSPAPLGDHIAAKYDSDELAAVSAKLGMAALGGEKGLMYDSLVYSSAICLTHLKRFNSIQDAASAVRSTLDSGKALDRFKAASR